MRRCCCVGCIGGVGSIGGAVVVNCCVVVVVGGVDVGVFVCYGDVVVDVDGVVSVGDDGGVGGVSGGVGGDADVIGVDDVGVVVVTDVVGDGVCVVVVVVGGGAALGDRVYIDDVVACCVVVCVASVAHVVVACAWLGCRLRCCCCM